nr:calcium/proton exchanger [Tanacetum cinerariifolium]
MSYDNLRKLVRKPVHCPVNSLYYCKVGKTVKQGLRRLENDADVQEFLKTGYESKWVVDLYVEHHGYDPMDHKNSNDRDYKSPDSSDAYCSSDDEHVIDYVDFYHEGEHDVVVKNITTNDPFLIKLCCNNRKFRGFINEPIPVNEDLHIKDPDSSMRYDHPEQLKLALANYGVAGGYQLWFQKNDWRQLLVYCGIDVSTRRCAWYFSKKVKKQLFTESHDDANKGTSKKGEESSRNSDVSPKWTKSKIASSKKSGQPQCGFRLWASWMSTENSFQIKSFKAEHKCARNYNLGSLVTYKWIAHHFAKEIIEDTFMPLLKMKAAIREKFLINVSLGQCKRAKQRALYDFEGGFIEHYARLWEFVSS